MGSDRYRTEREWTVLEVTLSSYRPEGEGGQPERDIERVIPIAGLRGLAKEFAEDEDLLALSRAQQVLRSLRRQVAEQAP